MKGWICLLLTCTLLVNCRKEEMPSGTDESYFPPNNSDDWATTSIADLNWNDQAANELLSFLEESETRGFIVLKDGKIVIEEYWNKTILGQPFDAKSNWYWASAAKTLTSFLVGQAVEEGKIDLEEKSSTYLGAGWSSLTSEEENRINVRHHLTMTTGLDDGNGDVHCTDKECLTFLAQPGSRWAYHNGPYTILDQVVEGATGEDFDNYYNSKLKDPIGMDGFWTYQGYNHLYFSTVRSMARFGLLISKEGIWAGEKIMDNPEYLAASVNSSQNINPSYGYLWWLNGKSSHMLPGLQLSFPGSVTPSAPDEMYAAMGKNGQFINVVPSENLIVIRMGANPDNSLVPTTFQEEVWQKMNKVMNK